MAGLMLVSGAAFGQTSATAQSAADGKEKIEFNPHGFLGVQGGIGITRGEAKTKDLISPAVAVSGGYLFNPVVGLRGSVNGWQAKGGWSALDKNYKFNFAQVNADVMFNLTNLIGGYNYNRVVDMYAFVGVGANYAFDNDEAVALAGQPGCSMEYLWTDDKFFVAGRAGLGLDFRLCDRVRFNLEGNANLYSDHFNSKNGGNVDWHFNVMAGFTFHLGKTHKKSAPAVPATPVIAPVEQQREEPKPVVKPVEEKKPVEAPKAKTEEHVFFKIDSYAVRSSEEAKVARLVEFLKKNPQAKVTVTGYADAKTGRGEYNMSLSRKRAEAVAALLRSKGIDAARISVSAKGDTVQPFRVNAENRVTICVAE